MKEQSQSQIDLLKSERLFKSRMANEILPEDDPSRVKNNGLNKSLQEESLRNLMKMVREETKDTFEKKLRTKVAQSFNNKSFVKINHDNPKDEDGFVVF